MNPIIYLILDRRYRHNFKVKVLKMNLPDLTSRRGTIAQPTISTRDSTMRESTVYQIDIIPLLHNLNNKTNLKIEPGVTYASINNKKVT